MIKKIRIIIAIIIFVLCLVFGLVITISNPDMTEMRLLITYWKEYLLMVVGMLVGYLLIVFKNE